jgi:hypothetical protein
MVGTRTSGFAVLAASFLFTSCLEANEITVSLSGIANNSWAKGMFNLATPPTGLNSFNGIPFLIPNGQTNAWFADTAAGGGDGKLGDWGGSGTVSATVNVNVYGADKAFTLINTYWGIWGMPAQSYLSLTFKGSAGATYTDYLYGGSDFRDWNNYSVNSISGSTLNAWNNLVQGSNNWQRLDMQAIPLPIAFATQTLQTVTITDFGGPGTQRAIWAGFTLDASVPEPSTTALMISGLALGCLFLRRRAIAPN